MAMFRLGPSNTLRGPRIVLRQPAIDDLEPWIRLREASRDFLVPWEPTWASDATSGRGYKRRLERICEDWRTGAAQAFFMFYGPRADPDALLGGISLNHIRLGAGRMASLGYWIGRPYARSGFMDEALTLVVRHAFTSLRLYRLEAACMPANIPSQSLLIKHHFRREGVARGLLVINDRWEDHVIYARLADDPVPRERG